MFLLMSTTLAETFLIKLHLMRAYLSRVKISAAQPPFVPISKRPISDIFHHVDLLCHKFRVIGGYCYNSSAEEPHKVRRWGAGDNVTIKMESVSKLAPGLLFINHV